MIDKQRYRPRSIKWFNFILRWTLGVILKRRFRMSSKGAELFKRLKPPFVLVPTHHGILDPFMVNLYVPGQVYWVASDGNMRSSVMKFLMSLVGSIPKSKSIPDLETIGWIVDVIRKRGGVVGVFAEGQASWDGHTQAIIPSTAKLIKLLKVPVVVAVLKGSFSSQPRWAWNHRPGFMEIEYKLVMDGAEAKAKSADEVLEALGQAMAYDEEAWRENHPVRYGGRGRAKHLELALFTCPACRGVGSMRSHANRLFCRACGHVVWLSRSYRFMAVGSSAPRFATIREWDQWQAGAFREKVEAARAAPEVPIISDAGVLLLRGRRMNPMRKLRTGSLILFPDRLELATISGERLAFPLHEIEGEGVLKQQLFEFYHAAALYQFRFPRRFQSARKWAVAIGILKAAGSSPGA